MSNKPGRRKRYDSTLKAECRVMFVEHEQSYQKISDYYDGSPSAQCIQQWATKKDARTGKSWADERNEKADGKYLALSPQAQASKVLERINFLLADDVENWDPKQADALAKTQKVLEKIVDKKFQVPMMYELLKKLIEFLKLHYSDQVTAELLNAIRHFKNELRKKLELGI
jgi:hypothetical protein